MLFLLMGVSIWLLTKVNTFYVPNSDFLNYLTVGRQMLINPLDPVITSAPLYPVIIWIFESILPVKYPGVIGGIIFNIACFIATLYIQWLLARKTIGQYAIVPVLLFATNPLVQYVVLQPSNLPLTVLFVFLALFTYKKNPAISYSMMILGSMTRIEVIALFVLGIVSDIFISKKISCPRLLLVAFILLVSWYVRPVMPKDNYAAEILHRKSEIPNIAFIRNSVVRAPFSYDMINSNKLFDYSSWEAVSMSALLVWLFFGGLLYMRRQSESRILFIGFILLYSVFHILFPARTLRYSYLLLPFLYTLLLIPIIDVDQFKLMNYIIPKKVVVYALASCVIFASFSNGPVYIENQRWDRAERRLVSEWLNAYIQKPSIVYAFEPYVHNYYNDNHNIVYEDTARLRAWQRDLCDSPKETYIIFDNQTDKPGSYYDHLNGLDYFLTMRKSPGVLQHFRLVNRISFLERYAEIYKVINKSGGWCQSLFK